MELILFRHGKAETRSDAKPDFERELTSIGRKKLKQAARGFSRCLLSGRDVIIWTSPLVRAAQTAEILRASLGKRGKVLVMDAIPAGDLADLQQEWAKLASDGTLVIVGHEPMLSEWTEKLCGASLAFRPASAAGILLDSSGSPSGSLGWFMRAGVMARLCPAGGRERRERP